MKAQTTKKTVKEKSSGFTLVELMIATTVFSTILLLAATGVINIGRLYYKGVTTARTQETARSVIDQISRSAQLNSGDIQLDAPGDPSNPSAFYAVCMGNDRYTYRINFQIEEGNGAGLWHDNITEGDPCKPYNFSNPGSEGDDGKELLGNNMRLIELKIQDDQENRERVTINVGLAYGDDDLLTTYNDNGDYIGPSPADAKCKPTNSGGSFCAVSVLGTFVKRRFPIN